MGVEFWSTSFAAPEPSLLNLLVELVGNYPPMPLITEKTVRFYFSEPPRRDSLPVRLDSQRSSSISVARSPSSGPRSRPTPAAVPAQIRPPCPPCAHELKEEGNRLFQSCDYAGALRQYELALRLAPRGHPDCVVFHSNRAACLLQLRPVDHEAVAQECSLALQAEPCFPRALLRRARALETLGRHELALADTLALLALDPDHRDAIDLSYRLRARVNASSAASASSATEPTSRPSPTALGASAVVAGLGHSLPARPFPKKQPPPPHPATLLSLRKKRGE
ncbi:protein CLMP1-like [Miscanthus floridulus]|uniref:protein CLMP1-like n=1 Tax=Miscanthus floridulus TaxID=154761 RepID=UPI00345B05E0